MSDEFANAVEAGNGSGESWKPAERPIIFGTYIASKSNVGANNSMMYLIQEDGKDEPTGVWGGAVLDGRFEEIPIDSRVKIEFLGKATGKRGNSFNNFKVVYIKPTLEQSANAAFASK